MMIVTDSFSRIVKPAEPREEKAHLQTLTTRKRTTKNWQASSPAWSRNPVQVLAAVHPPDLLYRALSANCTLIL